MTGRVIFFRNQRNPFCEVIALCIVLAAMLLAAGCVGEIGDAKNAGNGTPAATVPSPLPSAISMPIGNQSPPTPSDFYWIKMNPIGDKQVGDSFTITSATNLSAGEKVLVQVFISYIPGPKIGQGGFSGATGIVKVIQGSGGINTISFVVNTTTFKPDEYIVTEEAINQETTGTALFNLTPDPSFFQKAALEPKNFIDWKKLDLPPLEDSDTVRPELMNTDIRLSRNPSQGGEVPYGSIIVFSPDDIVRCFDRNGTHYATYYGFRQLRFVYPPDGAEVRYPSGNVTTIMQGDDRILTEIYEFARGY